MARPSDYLAGIFAPVLGVLTSVQEDVEFSMRIVSLAVGIAVGLLAVYRHFKTPKQ